MEHAINYILKKNMIIIHTRQIQLTKIPIRKIIIIIIIIIIIY